MDLIAKAKKIVPPRTKRWWQKMGPKAEAAIRQFMEAFKAGKLSGNFRSMAEASRYLKAETGTNVSEKEIETTISRWGTPNGPR